MKAATPPCSPGASAQGGAFNGFASTHAVQTARQAYIAACILDVHCAKPGNVSVRWPGHGMHAQDFIVSALVSANPISDASLGVGARIFGAVQATRNAVGLNTNLGIVLLAAPLLHAYCHCMPGQNLHAALVETLRRLDRCDAQAAYRAIRLAAPAGLGASVRHDINDEPAVTLLEAMRESAARDSIARQYANSYADIWDVGLPVLRLARARFGAEEAAVTAVYAEFLATCPDSHVGRKHGYARAEQIRCEGEAFQSALWRCSKWSEVDAQREAFDSRLKSRGINPGTSADLTVAVILAESLETAASDEVQLEIARANE